MNKELEKLTKKQENVFKFICNFFEENKYYPSYKEIAKTFNFNSDGTVRTYLEILERKKYIKRHAKARAVTILHNPNITPILGTIKAGEPTEAIENTESYLDNLPLLTHNKQKFGLNIKGDSMINAGIFEGDIAIIEKNHTIQSGDIIAALIDHEATLKRYIKKNNKISLKAENDAYPPIIIQNNKSSTILGKCIGIIRSY
tara:strand:- start:7920 stop:8522 length:603 start_codon:yes stop_codon:yes gene_type:complete